jgi:hypothetical protein
MVIKYRIHRYMYVSTEFYIYSKSLKEFD